MTREFLFRTIGSAGDIKIKIGGDIGGNSETTTITCRDGQFDSTSFEELSDGFKLTIVGNWEIREIIDALVSALYPHNSTIEKVTGGWVEPLNDDSNKR